MSDPTLDSTSDRKKIMFYDSEQNQIKFKIRCQHDGLTQSQFFRLVLRGYIDSDPLLHEFLDKQKEKLHLQGIEKRRKINSIYRKKDKNIKIFALDDAEKESIFDMIEEETNL